MAGEDKAYTTWIRSLQCAACEDQQHKTSCHHRTGAGIAKRAHDWEAMPLCGNGTQGCHGSLHSLMFGSFKGYTKDRIRDWQEQCVKSLRSEYLGQQLDGAVVGFEEI